MAGFEERFEGFLSEAEFSGSRGHLSCFVCWSAEVSSRRQLANRAFHLELDQAVHLDGVLHRQLFHERLDETVDDHGAGFSFCEPAAGEIEQLLFADPRNTSPRNSTGNG